MQQNKQTNKNESCSFSLVTYAKTDFFLAKSTCDELYLEYIYLFIVYFLYPEDILSYSQVHRNKEQL